MSARCEECAQTLGTRLLGKDEPPSMSVQRGKMEKGGAPKGVAEEKTRQQWTTNHVIVARKLIVEGGGPQKRLCDIFWSDEKMCKGYKK